MKLSARLLKLNASLSVRPFLVTLLAWTKLWWVSTLTLWQTAYWYFTLFPLTSSFCSCVILLFGQVNFIQVILITCGLQVSLGYKKVYNAQNPFEWMELISLQWVCTPFFLLIMLPAYADAIITICLYSLSHMLFLHFVQREDKLLWETSWRVPKGIGHVQPWWWWCKQPCVQIRWRLLSLVIQTLYRVGCLSRTSQASYL